MDRVPSTGVARSLRGGGASWVADARLMALKVGDYWRYFWNQPLSFILASAYMFFEYYRPQSIYPSLAILPWASLCLFGGLAALLFEGGLPLRARSPVSPLLVVFSVVVFASMLGAWEPALSWEKWEDYWLWLPVYVLIVGTVKSFRSLMLFVALFVMWNAKMSLSGVKQWAGNGFHFRSWGVLGAPGPFNNSGEFGIEMVVYFSILTMVLLAMWPRLTMLKRLAIVGVILSAVLSVVASSSRGAIGALGLSSGFIVLFSRHRVRALIGMFVLSGVLFVLTPPEFKARFTTVGEDKSSTTRALYRSRGMEIMKSYPGLGVGYGNWMGYYRHRFGEVGQVPHNIYIQAGAELGVTGLVAFLALVVAAFRTNRRTRKVALALQLSGAEHATMLRNLAIGLDAGQLGFLGAGYFVTVLYYPFFWVSLALTSALHAVALQESQVNGILPSVSGHVPERRSAPRRPSEGHRKLRRPGLPPRG